MRLSYAIGNGVVGWWNFRVKLAGPFDFLPMLCALLWLYQQYLGPHFALIFLFLKYPEPEWGRTLSPSRSPHKKLLGYCDCVSADGVVISPAASPPFPGLLLPGVEGVSCQLSVLLCLVSTLLLTPVGYFSTPWGHLVPMRVLKGLQNAHEVCVCVEGVAHLVLITLMLSPLLQILDQRASKGNLSFRHQVYLKYLSPPALSHFFFFLICFLLQIIAFWNFVSYCQTWTWISHRFTYIPSLLNLPPISLPSHPSRLI